MNSEVEVKLFPNLVIRGDLNYQVDEGFSLVGAPIKKVEELRLTHLSYDAEFHLVTVKLSKAFAFFPKKNGHFLVHRAADVLRQEHLELIELEIDYCLLRNVVLNITFHSSSASSQCVLLSLSLSNNFTFEVTA
ncbi:hypothetical protein AB8613_23980 [Vibrio sp. BS-M-Sm-2]|uniref:hypothetical protein n=1 Tax=Vibrio sp. BS-M-Sm-2 TaxID=3241167 RepID=UPI0035587103